MVKSRKGRHEYSWQRIKNFMKLILVLTVDGVQTAEDHFGDADVGSHDEAILVAVVMHQAEGQITYCGACYGHAVSAQAPVEVTCPATPIVSMVGAPRATGQSHRSTGLTRPESALRFNVCSPRKSQEGESILSILRSAKDTQPL